MERKIDSSKIGIADGEILLGSAIKEVSSRYPKINLYFRGGGIIGIAQLLMMEEKEWRKRKGIGPKTIEFLKEVKKIIIEWVAKSVMVEAEEAKKRG